MNGDFRKPSLREALRLIDADLRRRCELDGRRNSLPVRAALLLRRGPLGSVLFRLSDYTAARGWRLLTKLLYFALYFMARAEVHVGARIGPGLVLPDIGGVGIPAFADIGRNCTFLGPALLTIGGMEGVDLGSDRIVIGDDCIIGHNARIMGAVRLADATQVRHGSVVIASSDKPGAVLAGMPARRRKIVAAAALARWSPLTGTPLNIQGEASMIEQGLSETMRLIREDIGFRCRYEKKPDTVLTALKMMFNPGVFAVVVYRWQKFFAAHHLLPLAKLMEYINLVFFAVAVDSRARIAGGLVFIHSHSIYIGPRVTIGRNCLLFHQNSIGFSPFFAEEGQDARGPVIGDDVIVGAGASICGPITVGSGTKVAVNSTLDVDCPDNSVMFGVPARQVAKT